MFIESSVLIVEVSSLSVKKVIKYLDIWLDKVLKMKRHTIKSSTKGEKCALDIARIIPNRGGASSSNRRIKAS